MRQVVVWPQELLIAPLEVSWIRTRVCLPLEGFPVSFVHELNVIG